MGPDETGTRSRNRLHPDAKIPFPLSMGLALQITCLVLPGAVMIPTVVFRAAGQPEEVLLWAVFASVAICGVTAIVQARRIGRFGAGYILAIGTSGAAIAVSIAALAAGGPALLATLVVVLALVQFAFSARLSLFRRILTPTVTGTVLMLTPVTVMPIMFDQLANVPSGTPPLGAPLSAMTTLVVIVGITLTAKGRARLWAPIIGIVAGSTVAGTFGLYDFERVSLAPWIGTPSPAWAALNLRFTPDFWALLPAFVFVALVCTMQTIGGAVAIQRVSWPESRAVDFRSVQGAVAADGVGNLLSGLAGTMPLGFRPTGASMVEITGVSSRRIGLALGATLIVLAFVPKALAVILALPGPVITAFITVTMATIFIIGMRVIIQDGIDFRKSLIAGVSFWIGVAFQSDAITLEQVSEFAAALLKNGMLTGGMVAVAMTTFLELTKPRRRRMEVELDPSVLREIRKFIGAFASRRGWDTQMRDRLDAVCEETLLTLQQQEEPGATSGRRLLLTARIEDGGAVLEFVASRGEQNIQDRMALLGEANAAAMIEQDVSLRLLRHLASSVRHQQYHDTDIVTVRVEPPGGRMARGM
ncbi:MAG: hypothetical protein OXG59_00810 [Gammaproteobacteria bacterium]|nr:hypothetical protein [Gammaproteobacteria bacterium]